MCALHESRLFHFSVGSNGNLEGGVNRRAIESNWGVIANRKFGGRIEKWVIIQGGKVYLSLKFMGLWYSQGQPIPKI